MTIGDLRRTSGSRLLRAAGDPKLVSKRLGRRGVAITANHNARTEDEDRIDILNGADTRITERRRSVEDQM